MTSQEIDDFCERGRVFYEVFPGTAASDEGRRHSVLGHPIATDGTPGEPADRRTPGVAVH